DFAQEEPELEEIFNGTQKPYEPYIDIEETTNINDGVFGEPTHESQKCAVKQCITSMDADATAADISFIIEQLIEELKEMEKKYAKDTIGNSTDSEASGHKQPRAEDDSRDHVCTNRCETSVSDNNMNNLNNNASNDHVCTNRCETSVSDNNMNNLNNNASNDHDLGIRSFRKLS
ncbi:unnamed protein product, partial [Didymodactylos carnosus]